MNEGSASKFNSRISVQSLRSGNSGSMSLGRPSFNQRNPSLTKRASLIYVMSIESDKKDSLDQMLQQNSYMNQQSMPWNRGSLENQKKYHAEYQRRGSNEGRTLSHACDCYPNCRGQQCPCFSARTQMCLKQSCCQICIQMKNAILMADRGQFCNCKQSQCLKSYCKCFHNNGVCTNLCKCQDCKNKIDSKERAQAIQNNKQNINIINESERRFCTCKKTKCNKKYCSCFANGIKCSKQCQCQNCVNCDMVNQPMSEERPPSFYNQEQFANMEMPDRMSFQKFQFKHYNQ